MSRTVGSRAQNVHERVEAYEVNRAGGETKGNGSKGVVGQVCVY